MGPQERKLRDVVESFCPETTQICDYIRHGSEGLGEGLDERSGVRDELAPGLV